MTLLDELLATQGQTRDDFLSAHARGPLATLLKTDGVEHSPDVDRVLSLPRRINVTDEMIDALSAALRISPHVRLFPAQAEALLSLVLFGFVFGPMRCGSGKTLVTLLAPTLLQSERPILIAPASLVKPKDGEPSKTHREFAAYRHDWRVRLPRLISYEELGREDRDGLIESLAPDLIMCDEAHRLRTKRTTYPSAMARRVYAGIERARPRAIAILSGTLITDRILDYQPAMVAAMGWRAPVPVDKLQAGRWGQALDRDVGTLQRLGLGALSVLPDGYHAHMLSTAGVVSTPGRDCDASIEVSTWAPRCRPVLPNGVTLAQVIEYVRASGMRPDGELLEDLEIPNTLACLSLGFFDRWDPMPPDWWRLPRRSWLSFARETLIAEIPGLASEGQIKTAIRSGQITQGRAELDAWEAVADDFEPNPSPVWLTEEVVAEAAGYALGLPEPTIVWMRRKTLGQMLAKYGVRYYGRGTHPDGAPGTTIACSIQAHATGKNLQAWARMFVLMPPGAPDGWEQLIARMHRTGQVADTVRVEVFDQNEVMDRVLDEARSISSAAGENQKLVDATWV